MTEIMSDEIFSPEGFNIETEMNAIAQDILTIVPEATETKKLSSVESQVSDGVKIILAHRKNEDPYQSNFIVSRLESIPDKPLRRETYRWTAAFPGSNDLQVYEAILPDRLSNKPASTTRKGFGQDDLDRLRDLVATVGEHERRK